VSNYGDTAAQLDALERKRRAAVIGGTMNEQQQGLTGADAPPALPDLPDLDALRAPAEKRLRHFTEIRNAAQAEIDAANAYLTRLRGDKPKPKPKPRPRRTTASRRHAFSDQAYRQVITAVGNHGHAQIRTIASEAGFSKQHTAAILRAALERGHVVREARSHRYQYRITDAGTEFATAS
jgi:predicted transcriptional regulator